MKNILPSSERVFLIGPGGVGKTTTGRVLAPRLGYAFSDLDDYFCETVENIRSFISRFGYRDYVIQNARCFHEMISACDTDAVIALSSGFLIVETAADVVQANREAVLSLGPTVLLVPSYNHDTAADIVARRQAGRGFNLIEDKERKKFLERIPVYEPFADIVETSQDAPAEIAERVAQKLSKLPRPTPPSAPKERPHVGSERVFK
ncbi:shikimate kinase [Rhodovulum sulfidophilum]|uniref:Shikimate kinase n=1 Tax=Rhodovulum sulfidophilum TaxID=35806 RepID=A0ABS1RWV2_RHOSU|nr:shikimate kinase [Rhodovulum sulfidophilum]MBL3610581.1 hypothetical protein [Rhodovulum sulfidophilum]MCE8456628.1 hypothetical protein [Rhodovulum sulfidophilum]